MRTDHLVRSLAADGAAVRRPEAVLPAALIAGALVSAALFAAFLGPRADIAAVATAPRFLLKFIETLLLAATASLVMLRLARPGARPAGALLLLAPALLAAAIGVELATVPREGWWMNLTGKNAMVCLVSVPLLSLPVLAALLVVLRRGAPSRPWAAGAVAGLAAGGLGAALYAAHCTDDSPLFVAAWYTLAIALVTAAGALLGGRLLRW
ncbi:MAG: DUF1109 domain-containing protein [Xanthobacteraceae bacterium]|nr:DUF1109 domain-containing protein [Xanthobacteraceae bacterium]PWB62582.1 MAG: DUF1109 domain-containing protein [Bradyrhizobiaceae bacterium]